VSSNREHFNRLYDFYGCLMTDRQQKFFTSYYHDDYSLQEIADSQGISRAAVSDTLKHCRHELEAYEAKLHLEQKYNARNAIYEKIRAVSSPEVGRMLDEIDTIEFGEEKNE
jgi:predicted DNA-binding protein YlxM (UPF0122 family)